MDVGAFPTPGEAAELCGADLDRALVDLEVARRRLQTMRALRDLPEARERLADGSVGVVHLHAKCGTGQGAVLMEVFQRQCDAEFLADWETARADGVDTASDQAGDPMARLARTDAQRRMDALHRLMVRGA